MLFYDGAATLQHNVLVSDLLSRRAQLVPVRKRKQLVWGMCIVGGCDVLIGCGVNSVEEGLEWIRIE